MQYDQPKVGDFSAAAAGLRLASLPTVSGKYANTVVQAGIGPILTPDPELRGTSDSAAAEEQRGFSVSDAGYNECGVEVYLASKNGQVRICLQRIRNQSLRLLSKS
jgi:hypothetical protein